MRYHKKLELRMYDPKLYFSQDIAMLQAAGAPAPLLTAWDVQWRGDLAMGARLSRRLVDDKCLGVWHALAGANLSLVYAKLGFDYHSELDSSSDCNVANFVSAYAAFTQEWSRSHNRVWKALLRMAKLSLRLRNRDAILMTAYLMGHAATIAGWRRLGSAIAMRSYQQAVCRLEAHDLRVSFFHSIVVAAVPCTMWLSDVADETYEREVRRAEHHLPPDPYYRSTFHHCCLYRSAFTGRIADAQGYAERLIRDHRNTGLTRYYTAAQLLAVIPLAVAGYSHLLGDRVEVLAAEIGANSDAAAQATCFRALAIIRLCQGKHAEAERNIKQASNLDGPIGYEAVWRTIDARVRRFALGNTIFDPAKHTLFDTRYVPELAPHMAQLLAKVVHQAMTCADSAEEVYERAVAAAVAEHLAVTASCVPKEQQQCVEHLDLRIFSIGISGFSEDRGAAIREQICALAPILQSLCQLRVSHRVAKAASYDNAAASVACQVAHDIRSPLSALVVAASHCDAVPEDIRVMIQTSVTRIKEIADVLLSQAHRGKVESIQHQAACVPIDALVGEIVAEKRSIWRAQGKWALTESFGLSCRSMFVAQHASELRRAISNILNNAAEAMPQGGEVRLILEQENEMIVIDIMDEGPGVPSHLIDKILGGKSIGKREGHGLGLSHACKTMNMLGGTLAFKSTSTARGACVRLTFPPAATPAWFVPNLQIGHCDRVAVIDDDPPIHALWDLRLKEAGFSPDRLDHFFCAESFSEWWRKLTEEHRRHVTLLADFDLHKNGISGLDLIVRSGKKGKCALVTSHYADVEVQQACLQHAVQLIPKASVHAIAIQLSA